MAQIAENNTTSLINSLLGALTGQSGTSNTTSSGNQTTTNASSSTNIGELLTQIINNSRSQTGTSQNTSNTQNTNQTQSQTGSNVSTTRSDITQEGITRMMQEALSMANGGVADIAGGAKATGLYNSTTQNMLQNDLLTRVSGELAKLQAGTTTTTTQAGNTTIAGTNTNQGTSSTNQVTNTSNTQNQTQTSTNTNNTTGTQNTTTTGTENTERETDSPLSNFDFGAAAGGVGGLALLQLLLPALGLGGSSGGSGGSGSSGIGTGLITDLLKALGIGGSSGSGSGSGGTADPNIGPQLPSIEDLIDSFNNGSDGNQWNSPEPDYNDLFDPSYVGG